MSNNKTMPTNMSVESFLKEVSNDGRKDAYVLIAMMQEISGEQPVMWGSSIIGFGSTHYKYDSGHEGDMPVLAFSPRKVNLTIYFEGFDNYSEKLEKLGKHKISKACLYINKLADVNLNILREMLRQSFMLSTEAQAKLTSVEKYVSSIPVHSRPKFDQLRQLVQSTLPHAEEVLSYGIIGYKIDNKRARVYISGWNDHVAIYPVPKNINIQDQLAPFIKGKGTIWLKLDEPLPKTLIKAVVKSLVA